VIKNLAKIAVLNAVDLKLRLDYTLLLKLGNHRRAFTGIEVSKMCWYSKTAL
jgi:hypothetical protein